jgi:hypothetical protein
MAQYHIPKGAGKVRVVTSKAGTPLVINDSHGKNKVSIPCKTMEQAEELCRKINSGDHQGTVYA